MCRQQYINVYVCVCACVCLYLYNLSKNNNTVYELNIHKLTSLYVCMSVNVCMVNKLAQLIDCTHTQNTHSEYMLCVVRRLCGTIDFFKW